MEGREKERGDPQHRPGPKRVYTDCFFEKKGKKTGPEQGRADQAWGEYGKKGFSDEFLSWRP